MFQWVLIKYPRLGAQTLVLGVPLLTVLLVLADSRRTRPVLRERSVAMPMVRMS